MEIAIIGGSGKMGKWFARLLRDEGHAVTITGRDMHKLETTGRELDVSTAGNIAAVRQAEVILLSVNIDSFEAVVKEIGPHVHSGHIVVDVTSIKERPVELMQQYCGVADILGVHPVFGPGAKDLNSQNVVLTPTNEKEILLAQKVQQYLEARGAKVSLASPGEHDEMMSVVLGLSHFISIVAADTIIALDKLPRMKAIGGSTYRVLTTLVESVISEDPELYATLQMHIPHVAEVESLFRKNTEKWAEFVSNRDKQGFKESMVALKQKYAENSTDFGQAYENMYKIMEWL